MRVEAAAEGDHPALDLRHGRAVAHHRARDHVRVSTEELRRRVDDHVDAEVERVDRIRVANGCHHQFQPAACASSASAESVSSAAGRTGLRRRPRPSRRGDRVRPGVQVDGVDHRHVDAQRGQVAHEQVAGVAVDLPGGTTRRRSPWSRVSSVVAMAAMPDDVISAASAPSSSAISAAAASTVGFAKRLYQCSARPPPSWMSRYATRRGRRSRTGRWAGPPAWCGRRSARTSRLDPQKRSCVPNYGDPGAFGIVSAGREAAPGSTWTHRKLPATRRPVTAWSVTMRSMRSGRRRLSRVWVINGLLVVVLLGAASPATWCSSVPPAVPAHRRPHRRGREPRRQRGGDGLRHGAELVQRRRVVRRERHGHRVNVKVGDAVTKGQQLAKLDPTQASPPSRHRAGQPQRRPLVKGSRGTNALLPRTGRTQLALQQAKDTLASTTLTAPGDGTVTSVTGAVGQKVGSTSSNSSSTSTRRAPARTRHRASSSSPT